MQTRYHLGVETEWRGGTGRRWDYADRVSFHATLPLLLLLQQAQTKLIIDEDGPGPIDDPDEGMPLDHHISVFHHALPFYEGERDWLAWRNDNTRDIVGEVRWTGRQKPRDVVLTAGRWQPVGGQNLLDRWWDWRRGIFDYEGQDSRQLACNALRRIGAILVPNYPPPPEYQVSSGA
jgi:hypothetical protein